MRMFLAVVALAVTAGCASSAQSRSSVQSRSFGQSPSSVQRPPSVSNVGQLMRRLWLVANSAAQADQGQVVKAEAVESSHARAVLATMDDEVPGDQPVWVVQVEGS